jgi:hypothetical protein
LRLALVVVIAYGGDDRDAALPRIEYCLFEQS